MSDITKCANEDCPLAFSCWRFNSPATEYSQAYSRFEPDWIDEELDEVECKFYIAPPKDQE